MALKMIKPRLAALDTSIAKVPTKKTGDLYGSQAWKQVRREVIRERGRACSRCGRSDGRPFVDHVEEVRDGGAPLDKANLQVLCAGCHTLKTAAVRAAKR